MKNTFVYFTLLLCLIASRGLAQNNVVIIDDNDNNTVVGIPHARIEVVYDNDTVTKITLGQKRFDIIENPFGSSKITMVHVPREKFRGHWSGVQLGFCSYMGSGFSNTIPGDTPFMEPNKGKSMSFTFNFLQYDIGLQRHKKNIGLITGLGWTVYNYRTDNQYTPINNDGVTVGQLITDKTVKKNKITTSYINIPLLLEAQIPSDNSRSTAFISAGVYGGFKIGSHIKTVDTNRNKSKSRDNININPFQYGAMVQLGYKFIKLYANYNFSTLYDNDKGPELYPYSIGLTLVNF